MKLNTPALLKRCPKSGKVVGLNRSHLLWRLLFPVTGLIALVWVLVRVLPNPSRATYPCMQVAAPLAGTFVSYLMACTFMAVLARVLKRACRDQRVVIAGLAIVAGLVPALVLWSQAPRTDFVPDHFVPSDSPNHPIGVARGIVPGRVTWAHDPEAVTWDGKGKELWSDKSIHLDRVEAMISQSIKDVADAPDEATAWDRIFRFYNREHDKGDVGYRPGEKIVMKVNLNNRGKGSSIDANPQVVYALLDQLVNKAGVPQENITVYEGQRIGIEQAIVPYCSDDFGRVHYVSGLHTTYGRADTITDDWQESVFKFSKPDEDINPWASSIPKLVVEADYLVNCALLKAHTKLRSNYTRVDGQTGISCCAKNHFGSILMPWELHEEIRDWNRGMGAYNPIVDLMSTKYLGGKTLLYIIDGLYAGEAHNSKPLPFKSEPFNGHWPSSIFMSLDPVAIDSVALDFIRNELYVVNNADNFLIEAATADKEQPWGGYFMPDGHHVKSLGVHEHWNNPQDRQYSRNLGTDTGIELYRVNGLEHVASLN